MARMFKKNPNNWTIFFALGGLVLSFAFGVPVSAQLNENCVVNVFNRTAAVKPDGSWVLPNVPTNIGQVRARATCVENGLTRSGQSDFFVIPTNGAVDVPAILLDVIAPVPESLTLTPPMPVLNAPGATDQLTAIANFPGGSIADVTGSAAGTNYTSSNTSTVMVDNEGLVTAVSSGTALISVLNDGVLGLLQVQVILSGDSDGDGIPDDQEIALGLNPNDPVDGVEDADQDGLNNTEEIALGTEIFVADTDGDGILDGVEVDGSNGFTTNPLLADTDGDSVDDGLEVATGSDPTDPTSFNLAQALDSISVSPAIFVLSFNTILPEASRQLTVTGLLTNGNTLDLTSTSIGTNYISSDLTLCSFGAIDGLVFAGGEGTCIVTITNNGFITQATVVVQSFAPTALSSISIPGYANNVDVNGDFAYVAAGATGLQVVNVSNPGSPFIAGSFDTPGNANDIKVVGTVAYIADGSSGLQALDVIDPTNPVFLGSVNTPGEAQDVVIDGQRAYVADGIAGLQIIDISNLSNLTILKTVDTPAVARGVAVSGSLALVADEGIPSELQVIDISVVSTAQIVGAVSIIGDAKDVVARDSFAYVAAFNGGFQIVDFSVSGTPQVVGSIPGTSSGFIPRAVALSGRFVLAAEQLFSAVTIPLVNIDVPTAPAFSGILDFSSLPDSNYNGTGIAATMEFAYMTAEFNFVSADNGSSGVTRLFIGQYLAMNDTAGIPPTVSITSPSMGDTFIEETMIPIAVDATDDFGVDVVDFLLDGQLVFRDTAAPFQFTLDVPIGVSTLALGARAFDPAGNEGTAQDVLVNVVPDPLTTVIGSVVDGDGNPVNGATVTTINNLSSATNPDGTFSIPGVSTILGALQVTVSAIIDSEAVGAVTLSRLPVPGGVTDFQQITLRGPRAIVVTGDVSGVGGDQQVHILNAATVSDEATVPIGFGGYDVAVVPDGSTAIVSTTGFGNQTLRFVDLVSSPPMEVGRIDPSPARGEVTVSCGNPGIAIITGRDLTTGIHGLFSLDVASQQFLDQLDLSFNATVVELTPDGLLALLAEGFQSALLHLVSISPSGLLTDTGTAIDLSLPTSGFEEIVNISVSPNGQIGLVAQENKLISILSISGSAVVRVGSILLDNAKVQSIAFAPDGRKAYVMHDIAPVIVSVLNIDALNTVTDSGIRISGVGSGGALDQAGLDQVVVTPDGKWLMVRPVNAVFVVDTATNNVVGSIPLQGIEGGIASIGKSCQ